jgi:hypothetical protein
MDIVFGRMCLLMDQDSILVKITITGRESFQKSSQIKQTCLDTTRAAFALVNINKRLHALSSARSCHFLTRFKLPILLTTARRGATTLILLVMSG